MVGEINIIKNHTRPEFETIFPNINIKEVNIENIDGTIGYHIMLTSLIPIIRDNVYLTVLIHRRENVSKKEAIKQFLLEANNMQRDYIIDIESIKETTSMNLYRENMYYKMEY